MTGIRAGGLHFALLNNALEAVEHDQKCDSEAEVEQGTQRSPAKVDQHVLAQNATVHHAG